ncbi:MAG: diguanylate cyclase [Pseudomonadota bacterium]
MIFPVVKKQFLALCVLMMGVLWHTLSAAASLSLLEIRPDQALGEYAAYLKETAAPLTLQEVIAAHASGKFTASSNPILTFGIGSRPVWVHLAVSNTSGIRQGQRLLIENSWQDHVDVYFVRGDQLESSVGLGDSKRFKERPIPGRFFAVDHDFELGATDIFIRVQTDDPIVLPLFLLTKEDGIQREQAQSYSYGFVYGYLIALLAYNMLLYLSLRDKRNLYYAAFVAMFVMLNFAYTGHGFAWLWPEQVAFQRWIIPSLMVLCGVSGLAFAKYFLNTRLNFPRTHTAVTGISVLSMALVAIMAVFGGSQLYALLVAFIFMTFFSFMMLVLGLMSFFAGHQFSRYFLIASIASMIGAAVTTLSVWGLIPFSDWKYRAIEIGMLIDATLLALALAAQVRLIQQERIFAEQRATRDPLTDLYNRRSFLEMAQPIWSTAQRNARDVSLIMLDVDHFKSINDRFGHAMGDAALVAITKVLAKVVREGDIVARWGGEEFLILLPETNLESAVALAERLQNAISEIRLPSGSKEITFTASFGVAHKNKHANLENVISEADNFLYQSKNTGRNKITSALG